MSEQTRQCSNCSHWDCYDKERGGCFEISKHVFPDQSCNYELLTTPSFFRCMFYSQIDDFYSIPEGEIFAIAGNAITGNTEFLVRDL